MQLQKIISRLAPFLALTLVFLLFVILNTAKGNHEFFSFYNIKTIFTQTVIVGIAALGMTFIIISKGIDLSAGSQIALGTVVVALVLNATNNALLAALAGILACMFCGFLIGSVVSAFGIVPFIVTLGMMQIARGTAKYFAKEQTVTTAENAISPLMVIPLDDSWLIFAPGVWILGLLLILTSILLKYTVFGRYVFAIGSNEETARLCGINVKFYKIAIYALGAVFTGIASVMQFANLTVGDPTAANGMELDIIAAVVIGGGSLNGGEGTAQGAILGALMIQVLRNGCNMLGVPNYVQEIIIGIIIIGAVLVDKLRHKQA
ncbi:MAG: ABC transporter permease [Verrucomicrobia bacterium]|nr:ABC transporter permease [Cytophagales bacterium]